MPASSGLYSTLTGISFLACSTADSACATCGSIIFFVQGFRTFGSTASAASAVWPAACAASAAAALNVAVTVRAQFTARAAARTTGSACADCGSSKTAASAASAAAAANHAVSSNGVRISAAAGTSVSSACRASACGIQIQSS